jgi:hypothetical protein
MSAKQNDDSQEPMPMAVVEVEHVLHAAGSLRGQLRWSNDSGRCRIKIEYPSVWSE